MSKDLKTLMHQATTIVRDKAPFDTGNLRYNAIKSYITPTGFKIVSRFGVAFYGTLLDQKGAGKKQTHKGWFSTEANLAVSTYMHSNINDRKGLFEAANAEVAKFAKGDPERLKRFYNSIVPDDSRDAYFKKIGL